MRRDGDAFEKLENDNCAEHLVLALSMGKGLIETLGDAQPIRPVVSPRELFEELRKESRLELADAKPKFAVAYVEVAPTNDTRGKQSSIQYSAHQMIDDVLVEIDDFIENINRRLSAFKDRATNLIVERDEQSLVYYQYAKRAIAENRKFLVSMLAN